METNFIHTKILFKDVYFVANLIPWLKIREFEWCLFYSLDFHKFFASNLGTISC